MMLGILNCLDLNDGYDVYINELSGHGNEKRLPWTLRPSRRYDFWAYSIGNIRAVKYCKVPARIRDIIYTHNKGFRLNSLAWNMAVWGKGETRSAFSSSRAQSAWQWCHTAAAI